MELLAGPELCGEALTDEVVGRNLESVRPTWHQIGGGVLVVEDCRVGGTARASDYFVGLVFLRNVDRVALEGYSAKV